MKNFKITSAIFNEIEEVTEHVYDNFEEYYDVLEQLGKKEIDPMHYDIEDLNEVLMDFISINRVSTDSMLYEALRKYFYRDKSNVNGYELEFYNNVRSCVFDGDYMYYVTGCGYDTISSDLLGGEADGVEKYKFLDWLNS